MRSFLKYVLATVLGIFLAVGLLLTLVFSATVALHMRDKPEVEPNSVLRLALDRPMRDHVSEDSPLREIDPTGANSSLVTLLHVIEQARKDPRIKGISLELGAVRAGITQLGALRRALECFKRSGKFIWAYSDNYSQSAYYLSTVADSVYTNPVGSVELRGLALTVNYFKSFGDRYGLQFEVFRHGKFKAAVEPFLQDSISRANRQQLTQLLGWIWRDMTSDIAKSRGVRTAALQRAADSGAGLLAQGALRAHLIDAIRYRDQYEAQLRRKLGLKADEKIAFVTPDAYHLAEAPPKAEKDRIAVVFAQGEIGYRQGEEAREDQIDQITLGETLKTLRSDDHVKAVVLRINSPGGSGLASELIWREVALTEKKKPVIVSMGDYAASGGYYIACRADEIFAETNTLTGSIGVFSVIPNAKTLANEQGIHTSVVKTNTHAHPYGLTTGISKGFKPILQSNVDAFYHTFIKRVAQGRNLKPTYVDSIAQGRVWAAPDALRLGLVDRLGTLGDAIRLAAQKVGSVHYSLEYYPKYPLTFSKLLREFSAETRIQTRGALIREALGQAAYQTYKRLKTLRQIKGPIAMLPFALRID